MIYELSDEQVDALRKLVEYVYADEENDFDESPNHIFRSITVLDAWLQEHLQRRAIDTLAKVAQ